MGHQAVWIVLEEMVADLRKKGETVPPHIISELRSAKTLISILRADPSHIDTSQKIDEHLLNIEAHLVSEAQENVGKKYVEKWLKRLEKARRKSSEEEEEETRFISGIPRDQKWIRVKASAELPLEDLKTLVSESRLSYNVQDDNCLLVYGKKEDIKDLIKKMTTKYRLKSAK